MGSFGPGVLSDGLDGGSATLAVGFTAGSWGGGPPCKRSSGSLVTLASDLLPGGEPVGVSVGGEECFWAMVPGAGEWLGR